MTDADVEPAADYPEVDTTLSRNAEFSTYTAADVEEQVPQLGTAVVQELGTPTETAAPKTKKTDAAS